MKKEIVLWESQKRLASASNQVLCITFITTEHSVLSLVPLMLKMFYKIKMKFFGVKLFSLKQYCNDRWRPWNAATEEMPGFKILLSPAPPIEIKKICLALEKNSCHKRVADIDVHVLNREQNILYKIRRLDFIDELYP